MPDPEVTVQRPPTFEEMLHHHRQGIANNVFVQLRQLRCVIATTDLTDEQELVLYKEAAQIAISLQPLTESKDDSVDSN